MSWKHGLMIAFVGITCRSLLIRFKNEKMYKQHNQYELKKIKTELANYKKELNIYFATSTKLLDSIVYKHRELYQHVAKGIDTLSSNAFNNKNYSTYNLSKNIESKDNFKKIKMPRDYLEDS